jgi:hypothetical protein
MHKVHFNQSYNLKVTDSSDEFFILTGVCLVIVTEEKCTMHTGDARGYKEVGLELLNFTEQGGIPPPPMYACSGLLNSIAPLYIIFI